MWPSPGQGPACFTKTHSLLVVWEHLPFSRHTSCAPDLLEIISCHLCLGTGISTKQYEFYTIRVLAMYLLNLH